MKHRERRRESAPHARGPAFAIRPEPDAVERRFVLSGPGGIVIEVDQIEIGGKVVGFFSTSPLTPGTAYPVTGTYNVSAPNNTALTL